MQVNHKHTLIAEIIGREYVKRNARDIKMVAQQANLYNHCKLNPVRRISRLSVVSKYAACEDRSKPTKQRGNELIEQRTISGTN